AAAVLAVVPPRREVVVNALRAQDLVVAALRRRAVPRLPVGAVGDRLLGQIARHRRGTDANANRLDLADAAVADVLDGLAESAVELAALLAAGLEDHLALRHRIDDGPSLGDGEGQR